MKNAGFFADAEMPYPRLCAHRGLSGSLPENTMPAWGAAVALGAKEIEFDLWETKDGEIVSCHDRDLERVSTGTGMVFDHTYEELLEYDFGIKFGEKFKGLKIATLEEILQKFGGQVIMNMHIKTSKTYNKPFTERAAHKISALLDQYDCRRYVYIMSGDDQVHELLRELYPDLRRCCGDNTAHDFTIVDRAIALGCQKVQFFTVYFNQEMIDKAHAHGLKCNMFYADTPEDARRYLDMGMDTILTNEYLAVSTALNLK